MARQKDVNWNCGDPCQSVYHAQLAVLMDIRDELKRMNGIITCQNFIEIPRILRTIRKNTYKKKRGKTKKKRR